MPSNNANDWTLMPITVAGGAGDNTILTWASDSTTTVGISRPESPLQWLDRRVREVQNCWK